MNSFALITTRILLALALILSLSCCRKHAQHRDQPVKVPVKTLTRLESPRPNTILKSGDSVQITVSPLKIDVVIDSVTVSSGKGVTLKASNSTQLLYWQTKDDRVGQTTLRVMVYYNDSLNESHNVNIVVLSDIVPEPYTYEVVDTFPHDNQAYTQGLVYEGGRLYESTGLEGQSSLRVVNIPTGEPDKLVSLPAQYFGEGIAVFNDQVYQITYKSQVGFVYDKNTLEQIRSFDYQIREGWGLATDGKSLIMSDGSAMLYYIDPEYFTQTDKLEVFDQKGMVDSLNEIEYVNGKILANVYGQTYIVVIDPVSGKVTGKIELRNLMPQGFQGDYGKVLNGIAYNPANGHLYVTGKHWPVLYEIKVTPEL